MPIFPPRPKVTWKSVAVTGNNPEEFARALQTALQELTDRGFNIISQQTRGESVIITGQLMELDAKPGIPPIPGQPVAQVQGPVPPGTRRVAQKPQATPAQQKTAPTPHTTEEVLYVYLEDRKQKSQSFPNMVSALRLVRKHITGESSVIPVRIVTTQMTHFEPTSIPFLLRSFVADLDAEEKKLVE